MSEETSFNGRAAEEYGDDLGWNNETEIQRNYEELGNSLQATAKKIQNIDYAALWGTDTVSEKETAKSSKSAKSEKSGKSSKTSKYQEETDLLDFEDSIDERRHIKIKLEHGELSKQTDEVLAALGKYHRLYSKNNLLVHVVENKLSVLQKSVLLEKIDSVATFRRGKRCGVPKEMVSVIHERGYWKEFPEIEAIAEHPIIRKDGSIRTEPGYDEETKVYLVTDEHDYDIPPIITAKDAADAVSRILVYLYEFPMEHRDYDYVWLAALLTPFARFAFEGKAPMFMFKGRKPQCGKGRLLDMIFTILTGRSAPVGPYPSKDDEMRKKITGAAMEGAMYMVIDNIKGKLGGSSLEAAITGTFWQDRLLGGNINTNNAIRMLWYATGNNFEVTEDITSRMTQLVLGEQINDKEFTFDDILGTMKEYRHSIIRDCLIILAHHLRNGRPPSLARTWPRFEDWGRTVRDAIMGADGPDIRMLKAGLKEVENSNADSNERGRLIHGWATLQEAVKVDSLTVAEAIQILEQNKGALLEVYTLFNELSGGSGELNPLKIGKAVSRHEKAPCDGFMFTRLDKMRHKVVVWTISSVEA